ncbi:cbb3-type cytochrome oxidase assembly protein CcoS [Bdellovibrio sp. HCB185ZH]|uniref:cbb3-type cytochrome oxidase assembly protein CcoS n=1 Tax=Bdellovibrio TaxID=958 RepID=UPI0015EA229E|nr:cbb3-type cytochrome oxidase assembly protein CcoS [Bdellovibrio sp. KM01]QLY24069.1 cbb3-type cytochrome oxidase assembly protein CcoS [Bdellovibrio sp. KM01]
MNIIILMIPMALLLGVGFLYAFFWANKKGQFDDLETPAHRMLLDENERTEREHTK